MRVKIASCMNCDTDAIVAHLLLPPKNQAAAHCNSAGPLAASSGHQLTDANIMADAWIFGSRDI